MKSIHKIKHKLKNPVVTVGTFDGVHLGHQKIMQTLVKRARAIDGVSVVITYHPHPLEILNKKHFPYLLTEKVKKEEFLKEMGIDYVLWLDFNEELVNLSPEDFIKEYFVDKLAAEEIIIGYDWHFGKDRAGDYHLLKKFEKIYGYKTDIVKEVRRGKKIVSSTKIREYIRNGKLELAQKMLGRNYSILGKIVQGDKIGRQLGFPTTNLKPIETRKLFPQSGVYLTKVQFKQHEMWGLTNIGIKPTIKKNNRRKFIETYIFDFNEEIYSEEIELIFIRKIRDEKKFKSKEELINQIKSDEVDARNLLRRYV
ncbi:MAG: bifunctional riboflavin kinase/FAD synthetase [Candidatus Cloacimonetes bacterium]|nr:bifunctional riboflavin kinase/FAD synthetase [Candidatus Cloacimonadota bacterium]MBL7086029.1 bifunctional riboflavin kinase/FAD synthetase [Candidatus Cloacimonadota bacterium]